MHKLIKFRAFSLIELIVVLGVVSILATITSVAYNGWRTRLAETQIKNDLIQMGSAMDNARIFGSGYPSTLPTTYQASSGNTLTLGYVVTTDSYCIDGNNTTYSLYYYVNSAINPKSPQLGSCLGSTVGRVLAVDAASVSSYPGTGTTWLDISGTGSNGTLYNGPTYDSTIKSFSFDGSNDYMDIPYSSTRDFGTSNFTIDIWMKMPSQANRPILELGAYNTNGLLIRTNEGGSSKYSVYIGGTLYTWNYSFGANTWYNAILTRNSSTTMELYVNSVSQGTVTIPAGATVTASSGVTRIAQILSGSVGGGNFIGNIGAIKAYNRSLSATEVTQNYYATRQSLGL